MTEAYLFGFAALALFWVFSATITGKTSLWALAISENPTGPKRLSASKFQALVWTLITLFAYASVTGARLLEREAGEPFPSFASVPLNLLVLMGLSAVTAAGSKGVTISYRAEGRIPPESGGLTTNPHGQGDLIKVQMLVWTIIAGASYLLGVANTLGAGVYAMPDVDGALLALMGVSQGSYVGNKLVSTSLAKRPKIKEILPLRGPVGTTVTIMGEDFGSEQGKSYVALGNTPIEKERHGLGPWSDFKLQVTIPATYQAGDEILVRVNRDGEWNQERHLFEVT